MRNVIRQLMDQVERRVTNSASATATMRSEVSSNGKQPIVRTETRASKSP